MKLEHAGITLIFTDRLEELKKAFDKLSRENKALKKLIKEKLPDFTEWLDKNFPD